MKAKLFKILLVVSIFTIGTLSSCRTQSSTDVQEEIKEDVEYTCSMHPSIIKDNPGQCPICGMDLVEKN